MCSDGLQRYPSGRGSAKDSIPRVSRRVSMRQMASLCIFYCYHTGCIIYGALEERNCSIPDLPTPQTMLSTQPRLDMFVIFRRVKHSQDISRCHSCSKHAFRTPVILKVTCPCNTNKTERLVQGIRKRGHIPPMFKPHSLFFPHQNSMPSSLGSTAMPSSPNPWAFHPISRGRNPFHSAASSADALFPLPTANSFTALKSVHLVVSLFNYRPMTQKPLLWRVFCIHFSTYVALFTHLHFGLAACTTIRPIPIRHVHYTTQSVHNYDESSAL